MPCRAGSGKPAVALRVVVGVGRMLGLSLLIVLNFNHRGTCFIPLAGEHTENTDGRVLLGWKEATEAAFGREIDSIYSPRTRRTSVLPVPLW